MWHKAFSNQLRLIKNVLQFRKFNMYCAPTEATSLFCRELSPGAAAARTQAAGFTHGDTEASRSRWSSTSREAFLWRREASPSHSADWGNIIINNYKCSNTVFKKKRRNKKILSHFSGFVFSFFFLFLLVDFFHELIFASNSILCLFERFCHFICVCNNPSGNISTRFYNCAVFTLMTHSAGKSDSRSDPSSALTVALKTKKNGVWTIENCFYNVNYYIFINI